MEGLSVLFMDIWTFAMSQIGLVAIGLLIGQRVWPRVEREIVNVADKLDGVKS